MIMKKELFRFTYNAEPLSRSEPKTVYLPPKGQKSGYEEMYRTLKIVENKWDRGAFLFNPAKASRAIERVRNTLRNTNPEYARGFINHYIDAKHKEYQTALIHALRGAYVGRDTLDCPIKADFRFFRTPPKTLLTKQNRPELNRTIWPATKPDFSNYCKLVEDCLEEAGIIKNDSQIIGYTEESDKYYTTDEGESPRTEIILYRMEAKP